MSIHKCGRCGTRFDSGIEGSGSSMPPLCGECKIYIDGKPPTNTQLADSVSRALHLDIMRGNPFPFKGRISLRINGRPTRKKGKAQ